MKRPLEHHQEELAADKALLKATGSIVAAGVDVCTPLKATQVYALKLLPFLAYDAGAAADPAAVNAVPSSLAITLSWNIDPNPQQEPLSYLEPAALTVPEKAFEAKLLAVAVPLLNW